MARAKGGDVARLAMGEAWSKSDGRDSWMDTTEKALWITVAVLFLACGGAWLWSLWRAHAYERQLEREYGREALDQIKALFRK